MTDQRWTVVSIQFITASRFGKTELIEIPLLQFESNHTISQKNIPRWMHSSVWPNLFLLKAVHRRFPGGAISGYPIITFHGYPDYPQRTWTYDYRTFDFSASSASQTGDMDITKFYNFSVFIQGYSVGIQAASSMAGAERRESYMPYGTWYPAWLSSAFCGPCGPSAALISALSRPFARVLHISGPTQLIWQCWRTEQSDSLTQEKHIPPL